MEGQGNETLEAPGFVLLFTQAYQMINPVPRLFDVPEQHGAIRFQTVLVNHARDLEPAFGAHFFRGDLMMDLRMEDFRAAPGAAVQAGLAQDGDRFGHRKLGQLGQEIDLHHGEGLQMHRGKSLFQFPENVHVDIELPARMQAAHDVELRYIGRPVAAGDLDAFGGRIRPGALGVGIVGIGTQFATHVADVGGIQMAIDVVVDRVTVQPGSHLVGQHSQGGQVVARGQQQAVLFGQALGGGDFGGHFGQGMVVGKHLYPHPALEILEQASFRSNLIGFIRFATSSPLKRPRTGVRGRIRPESGCLAI